MRANRRLLGLVRNASKLAPIVALLGASAAHADVLVELTNSSNTLPLIIQGQYQQTYGAAAFTALPADHVIKGIAFALDPAFGTAFSGTIADIEIRLSTVSILPSAITGLIPQGSDSVLVHDGSVFLSGSNNHVTATYDIVIPFDQWFSYIPANGSLLVDIVKRSPERLPYGYLEAGSSSLVTRSWNWDGGLSSGTGVGYGVSTRFLASPVPELSSSTLAAFGLIAILGLRRWRNASARRS